MHLVIGVCRGEGTGPLAGEPTKQWSKIAGTWTVEPTDDDGTDFITITSNLTDFQALRASPDGKLFLIHMSDAESLGEAKTQRTPTFAPYSHSSDHIWSRGGSELVATLNMAKFDSTAVSREFNRVCEAIADRTGEWRMELHDHAFADENLTNLASSNFAGDFKSWFDACNRDLESFFGSCDCPAGMACCCTGKQSCLLGMLSQIKT
jgi:hypothetical protein